MSINKTRCRKCNGSAFFMKSHSNNTGLYCGDCGAWQKWLNKDEINAWKHYFEQLDEMRISKGDGINTPIEQSKTDTLMDQINGLYIWIGNEINHENEMRPMISNIEAVRSLSYCYGLQQVKRMLDNIRAGREFSDDGDGT